MPAAFTRRCFLAGASVMALMTTMPAFADENDPTAFARSLYALENLWSDVTADEETMKQYLTPALAALVTENYAKEDFESALDYDPLIQAQDFDQVRTDYTVNAENETNAVVTVAVENFGERTFVTLDLAATPDGWRLADIRAPDGTSLVDVLKRLNAAS